MHPDVRLLVAEDNRMNQNLLRHLLGTWQLQYKIVTNGREVLQALEKQHFDLVLMDIQMPEMDGYTAVQGIRNELHSTIPVIAMTAHAMAGEREKCLQMGMNEYISKPINEDELYRLIQLYIGKLPPRDLSSVNHHHPSENGHFHLLNMNYLHGLSNGNSSFEKTMLEQFIAQLPEELSVLKQAVVAEDIAAIRASAHNLKTTVSFIGLENNLYPILEPLEKLQENNYHPNQVANQFNTLKQLCIQAVQEAINILL
jgi:CheY-like chemotaxis protein